jgi:hypothetical protein
MVSSCLRSVACRQKETGSYYYMKLDEYDMITLCIDRVEDRTRGGYYLNWILDGGVGRGRLSAHAPFLSNHTAGRINSQLINNCSLR